MSYYPPMGETLYTVIEFPDDYQRRTLLYEGTEAIEASNVTPPHAPFISIQTRVMGQRTIEMILEGIPTKQVNQE